MATFQWPTGGVNNTASTTSHFQLLRSPTHARTNFFVSLKTKASKAYLLRIKLAFAVVHGPSPHAPRFVDQLSHQFCRVSISLFSLRVTCGDPRAVVLSSLQSVLNVVTASLLKVKETIISLW